MNYKRKLLSILLIMTSGVSFAAELLIENVTLISPERKQPLEHAYIRIVDDKIIEVSTSPLVVKKGSIKINGAGQFLIPGLMDSHVHVSSMPGLADSPESAQLKDEFLQQQPKSYLYFGVTQLLDPSQYTGAIDKFNQSEQKPDLFHCGAAPILGGYPTLWADEETTLRNKRYLILDPNTKIALPEGYDLSQHTPEAVVQRMARDGAICVKVFIEDGFGHNNDWPMISTKLLKRVRVAATKHGLLMSAHANAYDMQKIAVQADVDVITHGMWNWLEFNEQPELPNEIRTVLDKIVSKNMVFQPTFSVMDGLKSITVPGVMNDPLYKKVVSTQALQWYQSKAGQWFKEIVLGNYDNMPLAKIHQNQNGKISQGERVVQYLNEQGLPIVLASDTPSAPLYVSQPGYSTFKELQHLFKAGLNYKEVLAAATINNAKAFGLAEKYGSIEPGKIANLLLLNKNPLHTIDAYNAIDKVIVKGRAIDRESLAVK
ncbi:MAG: amidohydrolase family protein [Colwellia sp.]|nr:amidohydrolase family protein [Colwellia sp.]